MLDNNIVKICAGLFLFALLSGRCFGEKTDVSDAANIIASDRYVPLSINCADWDLNVSGDQTDWLSALFSWDAFIGMNSRSEDRKAIRKWMQYRNHNDLEYLNPEAKKEKTPIEYRCDDECMLKHPPGTAGEDGEYPKLYDSQGNLVVYEIRVNNTWVDSAIGLEDYKKKYPDIINIFMQGECVSDNRPAGVNPSYMLKLAWKQLNRDEDSGRYILTKDDNGNNLGLVAMHIVVKLSTHWNWVWATFEHENNFKSYQYKGKSVPANFCSTDTTDKECKGTKVTPYKSESEAVPQLNPMMVRELAKQPAELNVLKNYSLLGVQYAENISLGDMTVPESDFKSCEEKSKKNRYYVTEDNQYILNTRLRCKGSNNYIIVQPNLTNPVIEPFHTEGGLSCIGCHVFAKLEGYSSDYSFTLENHVYQDEKK